MKFTFRCSHLLAGFCLAAAALPRPAAAQTYTYNGPFTTTGGTANPWSTDSWVGGTPTSSATTQLVFRGFDTNAYSANNDLGNPFLLNGVSLQNYSTSTFTVSSATGNSLQLTGANPTVTMAGPGNVTFGTGGNGLVLNPTSGGTTTFGGSGAGIITTGNNNISGSGGIVINNTGAGGVSIFGTNTFTGGVTLNAGSLSINAVNALGAAGNTLTINGGTMRAAISSNFANAVTLNSDLVFTGGTLALNGAISGAGGVQVFNGTNFLSDGLTFGGALTFAGALTIQNSVPLANPASGNFATVTLNATSSLGSSQTITVGNNGTLALTGNTPHILNANALVLNGGRLTLTGVSGGNAAETFGNLTTSGLGVITVAGAATTNTLTFGNLIRQDNATLFFRGGTFGAGTNKITFANGLTNVSDPLAPGTTGQYTGVVPFATTNGNATYVNAANRVTYDPVNGVTSFSPVNSTYVYQAASGETLVAANDYKNVNLTGNAVVADTRRVNSLSMSAAGTITGPGTLTVSSGEVMPVHGSATPVIFNGPTLDFGAATGYIHLGGSLAVQGASTITGSGGVVVSGLDASGAALGNGSGGGYNVQLSNGANPFTGGLYLNGNATVNFTSDAQLGAAGEALHFNGGALNFNPGAGSVTINRPITLGAAGGAVYGITGEAITLSGNITGSGPLTIGSSAFTNTGSPITLTGNNSIGGPIYIAGTGASVLRAGSDANLGGTAAPVSFQGGGGTLQFTASNTISKPMSFTGGGGSNLDTNGFNVTLSSGLSGVVANGFNKVGAGTLTLSASSLLYAGRINVNAGTLNLAAANTLPQVTILTVNTGGTLTGSGSVGGSVAVAAGGTVSPGVSGAGRIAVGNSFNLASGSTLVLDPADAGAGGATDEILVGGQLTLGGTLSLTAAPGFTLALNQKFFVIDSTAQNSPVGTFANGTGTGGLIFTDNLGNTYQINYADRDPSDLSNTLSNDVSLTVVGVVPEPSAWTLICGAVTALVIGRCLQNRRHSYCLPPRSGTTAR